MLVAAVAALAAQGGVSVWRPGSASTPDWTAACFRHAVRPDRTLLARCSRVRGRVLVVRHKRVGPRKVEAHVAVLAHFGLVLVKLGPGTVAPHVGEMIAAVGPLVRARIGLREVQAFGLGPG